uniref:Protein far1-related sequence 5-like isoform x2 n=1 Tax=Gigaspora margarita TaxID=4874 RepID=A0A8H4ESV8_GIGMA
MLSTQHVESINAVTHKYVNSHSSLIGFFNEIQAMLASELQKAEYRDYLENLPYNIGSSASSRVFPKLVEYLKLVLTDELFQIQKAQIDVCFKYNALPIPIGQFSLYNNANIVNNDACIEDHSDKRQVALKSLIGCVDLNNIIELWEVKHMNANTVSTNCIVLLQDQSHVCTCLLLFSEGLVCCYFFQVILKTPKAKFAITLIKNRWFKNGADLSKNLRSDDVNLNSKEIENKISKQQIYGEYSVLVQKLAALASEFNLMHISATLRGLIQQVEQANTNACRRRAKRIKSSMENSTTKNKVVNAKSPSGDIYTCRNCSNHGHNARSCVEPCRICNKNGYTYLNCQNKENV